MDGKCVPGPLLALYMRVVQLRRAVALSSKPAFASAAGGNPSCETRSQGSERLQDAQSGVAAPNSALSRQVGLRLEDFGRSPRFKRPQEQRLKPAFETTGGLIGMRLRQMSSVRTCDRTQERKGISLFSLSRENT